MNYPDARRDEECVDVVHGVRVSDPYRWLETTTSAETQTWIQEEREFTDKLLAAMPAREKIGALIRRLYEYDQLGVPQYRAGRIFYACRSVHQNQPVLYYIEEKTAKQKPLLDVNELSSDGTVALYGFEASNDGKLVAYSLTRAGSDWQEWHIRDVERSVDLPDVIRWVKFSAPAWSEDARGFFYARYAEPSPEEALKAKHSRQTLYYHRLGTDQSDDTVVFEYPKDPHSLFRFRVTFDGRFLVILVHSGGRRGRGLLIKRLGGADEPVYPIDLSFESKYVFIGSHEERFYFMTDRTAPMGQLIDVTIADGEPRFESVIPESDHALQDVSMVGEWFIATYLKDAYCCASVYDLSGNLIRDVDLPGMGTIRGFDATPADSTCFFSYSDFVTPPTIYRYDVVTGIRELILSSNTPLEGSMYVTEQIFYESFDGTRVPMFITRRRERKQANIQPTYLTGYGGFNNPFLPSFNVRFAAWLELGGTLAVANIRGGSEYGRAWHDAGRKLNKQNVFDDFIAAAEWLVEQGYTSIPKLAIAGGSNGGLLVGACMTQRPDLFGACLAWTGVHDMLRYHLFTIWSHWMTDYGSPDDPKEFQALRAYSPYHNVRRNTAYPPTLITTGDHDDRVFPAHSYKFAAALQDAQAGEVPILIRIDSMAGHGMGKPLSKTIAELTDQLSFLARYLCMGVS